MSVLIYDDRDVPDSEARYFLGLARYGDLLQARDRLSAHIERIARAAGIKAFRHITDDGAFRRVRAELEAGSWTRIVHLGSVLAPTNGEDFADALRRMRISTEPCRATLRGAPTPFYACSAGEYAALSRRLGREAAEKDAEAEEPLSLPLKLEGAATRLDDPTSFLDFLSGSLNSRHFNAMRRERREVVKVSAKIDKVRSEHDFYYLLPPRMQRWFVMPYEFRQEGASASYRMERLLVPDMGKQWIHGGLTLTQFDAFLEDVGLFLRDRARRDCGPDPAAKHFEELYRGKLMARLQQLREQPVFASLDGLIRNGTAFAGLEAVVESYLRLLGRLGELRRPQEAIGHGDLCFSNILYDKRIRFLKLIDPRGALSEAELYTDPYYDLAKLSHSVLGAYDFIVNDLYELQIDEDVKLALVVLSHDLNPYRARFVVWLEREGWDPLRVRLYEASLFLSMLPYHVDRPRNLLAFVLTAVNILTEVERQQ